MKVKYTITREALVAEGTKTAKKKIIGSTPKKRSTDALSELLIALKKK